MKIKMKLKDLKVNSFATSLDAQKADTAKGGITPGIAVVVTYYGGKEASFWYCG